MLQHLREKAQGWFAWIILGAIAITFVLFGTSNFFESAGPDRSVAKINGDPITEWDVERVYQRLLHSPSNEMLRYQDPSQVKKEILEGLIEEKILLQNARQLGLSMSPERVTEVLRSLPFLKDSKGRFSEPMYQQFLATSDFTDQNFRKLIYESLLLQQLQRSIVDTAFSLPSDLIDYVKYSGQERDFRYTIIDRALIEKGVSISDEMVKQYYQDHLNDFMFSEQLSLEYLKLSFEEVLDQIDYTDPALEAFYQDNLPMFTKEGKAPPLAEIKDYVIEQYKRYHAEEKLASLVDEIAQLTFDVPDSLQPAAEKIDRPVMHTTLFTQEKGPSEAWLNRPEIMAVAFSENVKEDKNNSDLIKLDDQNYVVIRLHDRVPAKQKPFEVVKSEIYEQLVAEKTKERLQAEADQIIKALRDKEMSESKALSDFSWVNEENILRTARKVDPNLLEKVFSMARPIEKSDRIVQSTPLLGGDYAVVWLLDIKDGRMGTLTDEQKKSIGEELAKHWGRLEFSLYTTDLMDQAKIKRHS